MITPTDSSLVFQKDKDFRRTRISEGQGFQKDKDFRRTRISEGQGFQKDKEISGYRAFPD
jgi:hypothetical protein